MGARGPLKDIKSERSRSAVRNKQLEVVRAVKPTPVHPEEPPKPPTDLDAPGRATWRLAWQAPWMLETDAAAVEQLCRCEDQAASLRASLSVDGVERLVWKEPILSSTSGEVVGIRVSAHPSLRELRRVGNEMIALRATLGLAPTPRARLGLAVVELERGKSQLEQLMERRHRSAEAHR
jgi:phage terminase small subunit